MATGSFGAQQRESLEMRQVGRAEYKNGYADVCDARGVLLTRQSCDRLVGYGPEGFVVMRGNCY